MIFKRNFWFNFFIVLVMIVLLLVIQSDEYIYSSISDIRFYTYIEYIALFGLTAYFILINSSYILKRVKHKKHYKYLIPIVSVLMILSILITLIGLLLSGNRIIYNSPYYGQTKNISKVGKSFFQFGIEALIATIFCGTVYALTYENVRKTGYYSKDE